MRLKFIASISFICCLFLLGSCIQFKKATLYDGVEPTIAPPKPKTITEIVEPLIYNEDTRDVWGIEKDECQDVQVSNTIAYAGNSSLHLNWNRGAEGCKWAGIGIGWDGYAGKDLSEILDYVAIQMYVRSHEGRMFGLPIVLTLEDYSGGMGFAYTGNKYFERSTIDEEWQKIVIPLNAFDMETESLNPTNIKQLQLELQQSGNVYLDDIRLVFFEPEPQEPWMIEEERPDPVGLPITIFDDAFINNNGWGIFKDNCQNVRITSTDKSKGQQAVHVQWSDKTGECELMAFGATWNRWFPVDIRSIYQTASFEFDFKVISGNGDPLPIEVGFEDYDRATSAAPLKEAYMSDEGNGWTRAKIPLKDIPSSAIDLTRIKHMYFGLKGSGEVLVDEIKLVAN